MKTLSRLALCLTFWAGAAAADDNVFKNVTVGIELSKPASWQFVTAEQNLENLKNANPGDDEFHQAMIKYSNAPLVAMMKHPEPFDDLNPSFKLQVKPYGRMKGADPKRILGAMADQLQPRFKDFKFAVEPIDVVVAGVKSAYMRINYSLQIPDGRTFATSSEMWIVPHGNYFFMIGAGTRQDQKTGSRKEIQKILDSIKLRPAG